MYWFCYIGYVSILPISPVAVENVPYDLDFPSVSEVSIEGFSLVTVNALIVRLVNNHLCNLL